MHLFGLFPGRSESSSQYKRDKATTEKLLQETIENHQAELATQKEFYTNALSATKETKALAEARANNEARTELESRLREAEARDNYIYICFLNIMIYYTNFTVIFFISCS